MPRTRCYLILAALLATCLASCKSADRSYIDWRWPMHVHEERQAWKEATGRNLEYPDGASPFF